MELCNDSIGYLTSVLRAIPCRSSCVHFVVMLGLYLVVVVLRSRLLWLSLVKKPPNPPCGGNRREKEHPLHSGRPANLYLSVKCCFVSFFPYFESVGGGCRSWSGCWGGCWVCGICAGCGCWVSCVFALLFASNSSSLLLSFSLRLVPFLSWVVISSPPSFGFWFLGSF